MAKSPMKRTPKGEAIYPYIKRPDTQFDDKGKYKVALMVDPTNEEVASWLKELKALVPEGGNSPIKVNDEGKVIVNFSSQFAPKVYDADAKEIPLEGVPEIGPGTVCKIAYRENVWKVNRNEGLGLYLQGFQIIELSEYDGGFEKEEGYTASPEVPVTGDDDMPF